MQLFVYLFAALETGGVVVADQYLGSGNQKDACKSSDQLMGFSAVFSLVVMAVLIILKDIILNRLFGEITPEVRKYADTYLTITAFSIPAIATNLSAIQVIPGSAIALGITTVISRCIGKGDYEQAKYYNRLMIKATYASLLVIDLSIYFALPLILPIYNLSLETSSLTTQMLLIHTLAAVCI